MGSALCAPSHDTPTAPPPTILQPSPLNLQPTSNQTLSSNQQATTKQPIDRPLNQLIVICSSSLCSVSSAPTASLDEERALWGPLCKPSPLLRLTVQQTNILTLFE